MPFAAAQNTSAAAGHQPLTAGLTSSINGESLQWEDEGEVSLDSFRGGRQIVGLSNIKTVEEGMIKFGLQPDDMLSRREQILMDRKIESAFEKRIASLIKAGRYDEVKSKREILIQIREQFEKMQDHMKRRAHDKEQRSFDLGKKLAIAKLKAKQLQDVAHVEKECFCKESYIAKKHAIQTSNLERELEDAIVPRMKNSTRLNYLKCAEKNLARLKQYDDAKNVYNMIQKLQPYEIQNHHKKFQHSLQAKREKLLISQEEEKQRLNELTISIRWKDIRQRQAERHVTNQRVKNLYWDMQHSHSLEDHQHVEMSIYPSLLLQKRPGYKLTGSGLRGSHFLDRVKGKTDVNAVFVTTLTDIHNFANPEDGTMLAQLDRMNLDEDKNRTTM